MILFKGRLFLLLAICSPLMAAQNPPDPEQIIDRFVQKETEALEAWRRYVFSLKAILEILGPGGIVREQRVLEVEFTVNDDGTRESKTVSDRGGLVSLGVTPEDIENTINLQPFTITQKDRDDYRIDYVGTERVDELDTFVFDIEPRRKKKGKRLFKGRLWVDQIDLQIVMTKGKVVPEPKGQKFPEFETVRSQVDGVYWFPVWTGSDDYLFGKRFRQVVEYENYKRYEVESSITYSSPEVSSEPSDPAKPRK